MEKFALVSHVLPPSWSGQSVVLGRLLKDIDPDSYILISREDYGNENRIHPNGKPSRYFHLKSFLDTRLFLRFQRFNKVLLPLEMIRRALQIARLIRKEKCNCIIACTGDLLDLPAAYYAARITNARLIPYYFDDYVFQWSDPFYRKFAQKYETTIFKQSSTVIVPNEFMKIEIDKRQQAKASIVRNPVNSEVVLVTRNLTLSREEIKIVYTGAIYHVNIGAFRILISAMENLKEFKIGLHLYTAQSEAMLLNEGISGDRVHIHSHASSKETALAQQQADILFVPFSFESTVPEVIRTSAPGKLADYLSSGVPILAFVPPDSFVSWFLKHHQCGLVIDENNAQKLQEGIAELINSDPLKNTFVSNAIRVALKEFDAHKASNDFMAIISKTTGSS